MTDVKYADPATGAHLRYLRDEELRQGIELLFFAYRDFTSDPDRILGELGFGRAHHRALHFIGRHPGLSVTELLAILRITKQSLSRVLKQLVAEGYVIQEQGLRDRRQRLLRLTAKGEAVSGYRKVLLGLLDAEERDAVLALLSRR